LPGDENYDLEELSSLGLASFDITAYSSFEVYPNPFETSTTVRILGNAASNNASVSIYDFRGRLVKELAKGTTFSSDLLLNWDGTNESGNSVSSGIYTISALVNGEHSFSKVVKR
jgi:flagellar hook assembly protein FlgD